MLLRAIRYCSSFEVFLDEREKLRIALLLNKYRNKVTEKQFNKLMSNFKIHQPLTQVDYRKYRQQIIDTAYKEKSPIDYDRKLFIHFTYCSNMKVFPIKFHTLWGKYFNESPINEVTPVLGTRNANNLQLRLTLDK